MDNLAANPGLLYLGLFILAFAAAMVVILFNKIVDRVN